MGPCRRFRSPPVPRARADHARGALEDRRGGPHRCRRESPHVPADDGHRQRPRSAHPLPTALHRPHEPGSSRRPGRGRGGHGAGGGPTDRQSPDPWGQDDGHRRGRRRVGSTQDHVLQPAVAPEAADPGDRSHLLRQGRELPWHSPDDEPGGRPHRQPHRPDPSGVPAVREGGSQHAGSSPRSSGRCCVAARIARSGTRCRPRCSPDWV